MTAKIADDLSALAFPVHQLTELERNPRKGDVDAVARSYERFGQRKPIVARRRDGLNEVVAGNHQLLAARKLGWDVIAVSWADDLSDDEARGLALADNRTAELGTFDEDLLAEMLSYVADDTDLLAATGYDLAAIEKLVGVPDLQADVDEVPEPPAVPVTKPGDLWLLGPHRVLCGDSTSHTDVTRLMNGERAVLMATDPPYLVSYDGQNHPPSSANGGSENRNKEWTDYQEHAIDDGLYEEFLAVALEHALIEDAPIYQWHAGTRAELLINAWQKCGVIVHQQIIWVKARKVLTFADFMQQHEPCYFGWRKGHRPDKTRRAPVETPTVWEQDQVGETGAGHPTQKPVRLIRDPVRWHTRTGDVIYEPFGGSGTALIAAQTEGRRCFAIELAPAFCDVICRRYQDLTGEKPVLESSGEPHDFGG